MKEPTFTKNGDDGGLGGEEMANLGIGGGFDIGTAGGAKGGEFARAPAQFFGLGKECAIFVIGAGPTAFDIVETVVRQSLGEAEFIGERKVDPFALGAIAQGGVVKGACGGGGHRAKA